MSKSKKNTIDPEKMIESYGADAVRLFILSDSPPEKDVQWSDEGMNSSYKFIQKLWSLNQKIVNKIKEENLEDSNNLFEINANQFISNVNDNINKFSYNKIIANFHELYSKLNKIIENVYSKKTLLINYKKILIAMNPVIPHFSNECLEIINENKNILWPTVEKKLLIEEVVKIIIQINGKTREIIEMERDTDEENVLSKIYQNDKLKKYVEGVKIKKKIFIPNKLINIIT